MSNLKDFTGKNREFTGEEGIIPSNANTSTTGNRVDTKGRFRFNSTTNLMEYYTGTEWKSVDSPPIVSSINVDGAGDATSTFIDSTLSGNSTIVIKGSLFDTTGASVTFIPNSGSNVSPLTTTINSASQITVTVAYSSFVNANEPYQVKVTNPSGLSATSLSLSVDRTQVFTNSPDTTYGIFDISRGSVSISASELCGATDPDGDTLTYSVSVGALPAGLTLNTSTGAITGACDAVGTNTTSTFSIAAATADRTITRQFKITRYAPVVTTYSNSVSGGLDATSSTFSIPTGLSKVNVLVVAGGAGGNANHAGGGGGGGVIYRPEFPISGSSLPIVVGGGSDGHRGADHVPFPLFKGQDSNFGTLVAKGGGPSHNDSNSTNFSPRPGSGPTNAPGVPGGSGGGGGSQNGPPSQAPGGTGIQPTESGDSGTYGFGNNGGSGWGPPPTPAHIGGGGGGAGAAGGSANSGGNTGGPGGAGREFNISGSPVYYGAGGGGGSHSGTGAPGGTGGGGNGNSQPHTSAPNQPNNVGTAGTDGVGAGGGGGSTSSPPVPSPTYRGGTGVVIVSY